MRLNYLQVKGYKNLPETVIRFDSNLITLLIGQNGMGKSNLLEVLATIYAYSYDVALGWENAQKFEKPSFDFILDYICNNIHIQIQQQKGVFGVFKYESDDSTVPFRMSMSEIRKDLKLYLPYQIFIYYSGENRRLETLYKESSLKEHSTRRLRYSKGKIVENPRHIITVTSNHSTLILLTLLIYKHNERYRDIINKVLEQVLNVDLSNIISITIQSPSFAHIRQRIKDGTLFKDYYTGTFPDTEKDGGSILWGVKGKIYSFLLCLIEQANKESHLSNIKLNERKTQELVYIDDFNLSDQFCNNLSHYFENPISFFNMINEMDAFGMINDISFHISKRDENANNFSFEHLSEGEQQYLTVMGLIALNNDSNKESLYLLDEPDTHINPKWQREYISNIENTVRNKTKESFFISTHSPFLVQAYDKDSVTMLLFKRGENGKVEIDGDNHPLKNWRIDQVVMSKYFGLKSSRPQMLDKFIEKRKEIIKNGYHSAERIRKELAQNLDEEGYLPTGETLEDVEDIAFIHEQVSKLKDKHS